MTQTIYTFVLSGLLLLKYLIELSTGVSPFSCAALQISNITFIHLKKIENQNTF